MSWVGGWVGGWVGRTNVAEETAAEVLCVHEKDPVPIPEHFEEELSVWGEVSGWVDRKVEENEAGIRMSYCELGVG